MHILVAGCTVLHGGHPFSTYAPRGGWVGSSLLYIFIAYYMQKGGWWVQIACKIAYVLNGRPHVRVYSNINISLYEKEHMDKLLGTRFWLPMHPAGAQYKSFEH